MRAAGDGRHGRRLRGLIVVLWRAGLRIHEALALNESDLDHRRGALLVGRGKGGRRREVGMDEWACEQLRPWLDIRRELPVGSVFCVISGPTRGRPWSAAAVRAHGSRQRLAAPLTTSAATPLVAHYDSAAAGHRRLVLIVSSKESRLPSGRLGCV